MKLGKEVAEQLDLLLFFDTAHYKNDMHKNTIALLPLARRCLMCLFLFTHLEIGASCILNRIQTFLLRYH